MLRLMVVQRLVVVLVVFPLLVACADTRKADLAGRVTASASPTPEAPSAPELPERRGPVGEGGAGASCVETYSAATIGNRSFAFDGTVVAIGPQGTDMRGKGGLDTTAVTFRVHEWFRGGRGENVTVDMAPPASNVEQGHARTTYEEGTRMLVSGEPRWGGEPLDDAIAWSCGFTRYYEVAVAEEWRRGAT